MEPFKVTDLFELEPLKTAKLVSGHQGVNNQITGLNIIEAPDVANWLQGGEVLLTNLYSLREIAPVEAFIEKLARKKLSALIVKVGVFVHEIPKEMIDAAQKYHLPIIEITKEVLYRDIAYYITERLLHNRVATLKYFKETHDRFISLSLANKGPQHIIDSLEYFIGNPISVYDQYSHCLFTTNSQILSAHPAVRNAEIGPYYTQVATFPEFDNREIDQIIFPIKITEHVKIYLVISKLFREIEEFQFIAIESAITSLTLEFMKQHAVIEVEKRFRNDLIGDLLSGSIHSLATVQERANLLQWDFKKTYVVVVLNLVSDTFPNDKNGYDLQRSYYDQLHDLVQKHKNNAPVQTRTERLIVLWDIEPYSEKDWLNQVKTELAKLQKSWREKQEEAVVQIGIGDVAATIMELSRSYQEAEDALNVKKLIDLDSDIAAFSELGIFRLLCQFKDRAQLETFIPLSLRKLLQYKQSNREDLVKTLKVFLHHNQNMNKTAQELFVHYKTVMYRIEKIREITNINFEDSEEVLLIQIGLKILTVTKR